MVLSTVDVSQHERLCANLPVHCTLSCVVLVVGLHNYSAPSECSAFPMQECGNIMYASLVLLCFNMWDISR